MTSWWMAVLAVPGVPAAVFVAAFAGLRLVARASGQKAKRPWRDAVKAWTAARDALGDARTERKNAAAELAAEKRRLKREQKAAGKPQSSPAATGSDPAQTAELEEVRRAVADAVQALKDKEEETSRRRRALTAARNDLRECAKASCERWRGFVLWKRRRTVQRAWQEVSIRDFLREYMGGWLSAGKDLLSGRYWTTASVGSLVLSLITVSVDLLYYRHFHLNALPFYASASLPALASTVLMMAVVIALSFVGFLLVVAFSFVGGRFVFRWLVLAVASLTWTLLVVLGRLPLLVSRSALCARLAAPGPESEAR